MVSKGELISEVFSLTSMSSSFDSTDALLEAGDYSFTEWLKLPSILSQNPTRSRQVHMQGKMIYTTHIIEGFNRQLRKVTKNRSVFPIDESLLKLMYLATKNIEKKWTLPKANWAQNISQVALIFPDRIELSLR